MDTTPRRSSTRLAAALTTALFVAAICVPVTASVFRINPFVPLQEIETPLPQFSPSFAYAEQVVKMLRRNWLDNNFGLRRVLVRWQQILDIRVLKSSMPSSRVFVGEDDWLYLAQENPLVNVMDQYRAVRLLTKAELDGWVKIFTARRDWLAGQGIRYMVTVAPNKVTIYPEHVPPRFNRAREAGRLDQMVQALTAAGIDVVDLRASVFEAKKSYRSYYRTDSHWTPYGAFFAYRQLIESVRRHFPAVPASQTIEDYTVAEKPGFQGALTSMIAMPDFYPEDVVLMIPRRPRFAEEVKGEELKLNYYQPQTIFEHPDKGLPRAFFIRDSFLFELIPYLSEHFSRMFLQWPVPTFDKYVRDFDTDAIQREKPDIVIDEFIERYFVLPPPPLAMSNLPGAK